MLKLCNVQQSVSSSDFCNSCQLAKSHRLPFVNSNSRALKPFELVHTDLWGPSTVNSTFSVRYFLLVIDDYSRYTWLYLLKTKDETLPLFIKFNAMVNTQFNSKIQTIQSDWGGE